MTDEVYDYVLYKIEDNHGKELAYIGLTIDFEVRKLQHKYSCNNTDNRSHNLKLYKTIRDNGNWECFKMSVIKQISCSKQNARIEENKLIKKLKPKMNTIGAYQTAEEKKEYDKQYLKQYNINNNNVEKKKEYNKKWRIDNADKIKEDKKQWRIDNPEKIKESDKRYRGNNKDKKKVNDKNRYALKKLTPLFAEI